MHVLPCLVSLALALAPHAGEPTDPAGVDRLALKHAPGAGAAVSALLAELAPGSATRPALLPARRVDRVGLDRWLVLEVPVGTGPALAALLGAADFVESVEELRAGPGIVGAGGGANLWPTNDPVLPFQWTLDQESGVDMDVREAWDLRGTLQVDPTLLVGIVDTGYQSHAPLEEFAGSVWNNPGEVANGLDDDGNGLVDDLHGYDFVNDDADPYADHDHGVEVSSVIGANTNNGLGLAGIADGVSFVHAKAFDATGNFPCCGPWAGTASAAAGLQYCVDAGCDLINNSWVTNAGFSPIVQDAVQYALDNGVHMICGAGNDGEDVEWPAQTPGVIAVAGIDSAGIRSDWGGGFSSNYGSWVDLSAGGTGVPALDGSGAAFGLNGTSFSAPNVAGVALLLLSEDRDLSTDDLLAVLQEGSVNVDALNPGFGGLLGTGHANALNSLELLAPVSDLGGALPGTSTPVLNAWGRFGADELLTFSVSSAVPSAGGALILGTSRIDLPFLGGVLVPIPTVALSFATDAKGAWSLPLTLSSALPPGLHLYDQALVIDLGAPQLVALSNALDVAVP